MAIPKIGMVERQGSSERPFNTTKGSKEASLVEINQKPATSKLEINRKGGTLTRS